MAYNPRQDTGPGYQAGFDVTENIDPGLRRYMLRVYNFMAGGLIVSGLTGYAAAQTVVLFIILLAISLLQLYLLRSR